MTDLLKYDKKLDGEKLVLTLNNWRAGENMKSSGGMV